MDELTKLLEQHPKVEEYKTDGNLSTADFIAACIYWMADVFSAIARLERDAKANDEL